MSLLPFLHRVANRENLTAQEAEQAMEQVLLGMATTPQVSAFLVALRMKTETPEEVLGFARAIRRMAVPVQAAGPGEVLLDTCGTGGDSSGTFNISTVAAIVAAGAGIRVAKHGNRSISSQCGSADVLEALGVRVDLPVEQAARCIREVGIGFLFAPAIHPAVRHAQAARQELKMRTVFNILGPLTNPANATVQIAGAPSAAAAELMAQTLAALGLQRGFVVHGSDGLDEITTTGSSLVLEIRKGAIAHHTLNPEDFGVKRATAAELKGAGLETNCAIAKRILAGEKGPARDIVVVNAGAALVAAGAAPDFTVGARLAADSIDTGAARATLEKWVAFTAAAGGATAR